MEYYIKNVADITYKPELTLDILFLSNILTKMSRVKFAQTTYGMIMNVSCGLIKNARTTG